MSQSARPPFTPLPYLNNDGWNPLESTGSTFKWIPVCSCSAEFPIELFDAAISQLVHHPEYNSTLILRSEIVEESEQESGLEVPSLRGFRFVRNVHRRLLPRRPGRDPPIEQDCTFYSDLYGVPCNDVHNCIRDEEGQSDSETPVNCLILTPKLKEGVEMPYYHPAVFHIAFRYLCSPGSNNTASGVGDDGKAILRIEVVLQPNAPDPKDINARLYRTCLALLETIHRYGHGIFTNYRKRVHHDCIVSREEYQDLYLIMRERHKHLVNEWHEATDPLKHVFEDIGIATFLMLLWKQNIFSPTVSRTHSAFDGDVEEISTEPTPWHGWPRPPGGFLDFGCGNGLLVHILRSEGYIGEGIDLRARTSWQHYPQDTQAHLHVHALNPLDLPLSPSDSSPSFSDSFLKQGVFIIANHADELSPWTPVLATLCGASGFLSIPCCTWSFDARFERSQLPLRVGAKSQREAAFSFAPPADTDVDGFVESLRLGGLGGDTGKSAYSTYRVWLACLGMDCGWMPENETLRIPSTRNWALVGRKRFGKDADAVGNALAIIKHVRERGLFKTRRPEGKAGDH